MCISLKPEMHLKDDVRPLIPVAIETQVDLQNRPEDQVLARQNTSGYKKQRAQSSRLGLGAADQPEDHNLHGNLLHLKFSALDRQCSSPRDTGQVTTPDQGIDVPL